MSAVQNRKQPAARVSQTVNQMRCSLCWRSAKRNQTVCHVHGKTNAATKRTQENLVSTWMEENAFFPSTWNARVAESCCLRPDFSWECQSHVTLLEVDENCHRSYTTEDERLLRLQGHLKKPIFVIRLNDPIKWPTGVFAQLKDVLQFGISPDATVSLYSKIPTASSAECKTLELYAIYVDHARHLSWYKAEDLTHTSSSSSSLDCK